MFLKIRRFLGFPLRRDEMTQKEVQAEIVRCREELATLEPEAPLSEYRKKGNNLIDLKNYQARNLH